MRSQILFCFFVFHKVIPNLRKSRNTYSPIVVWGAHVDLTDELLPDLTESLGTILIVLPWGKGTWSLPSFLVPTNDDSIHILGGGCGDLDIENRSSVVEEASSAMLGTGLNSVPGETITVPLYKDCV